MSDHDREPEPLPGRRTAIVASHWMTIAVSALVAVVAVASVAFAQGPRGSRPLGLALALVAGVTVWVTWSSLRSFHDTDRPRLLWMGLVGLAWTGVTLAAAAL